MLLIPVQRKRLRFQPLSACSHHNADCITARLRLLILSETVDLAAKVPSPTLIRRPKVY